MRLIGATVAATLALCACSSSGSSPAAASSSAFRTTYGQDAALLAGHIPGCTGLKAETVSCCRASQAPHRAASMGIWC